MKGKTEFEQKFCGNCDCHNVYAYPDELFCMKRFLENKNPIVKTLWHCEEWNLNPQRCQCLEDATRKEKK